MASRASPRAAAARALAAVADRGCSLDDALSVEIAACREGDRALAAEMAYGAVRWHFTLRALTGRLLERALPQRERPVAALIEVGLYQLWRMRVPDHAAVGETVAVCRELGRPRMRGLVNAVLRRFQREQDSLLEAVMADPEADPEAAWSHPRWLLDALAADWPDKWEAIARANNERAPMWVRVNLHRTDAAGWCHRLPDGLEAAPLPGVPSALRLSRPLPVEELPGFADGEVGVQDGAAQLAAPLLGAAPGMRVLDACAAPGGKTLHILESVGGDAAVTALDADAGRLERVREALARGGYRAGLLCGDAAEPAAWWDGEPYDRILVDAPCSATGVIRRHPDIKLLRRPADVERLAARQLAMLRALWPLLAPGGRLVYATCSVLRAENSEAVAAFAVAEPGAGVGKPLPDDNIRDLMQADGAGFQLFPGRNGLDGFFYCCIEKPT
ncbi:16S rRNA (cytosine(967)-C(5))-methyltransferase RsmB [Lentisalinibacter sediminis]|uniref:16S rRNA (cytosine(967)-C(5))-methyltransferase RsmB n=1 Tax=Lentisalinibacter sediminis TaxID=2992237 RepID=UPI003863BF8C